MTQDPQKSNVVLIIIAIIGVAGTIIAATIGVLGNYTIEKMRQETELTRIALVSIATQGGETQMVLQNTVNAPTEPPAPTYTPYPTQTPNVEPVTVPTDKPTTTPTAAPTIDTRPTDTPPGTELQVGETWITKGFSAQFRSIGFSFGDQATLELTLTNNTGRTLFFHLNSDVQVIMKNDSGKIYTWSSPYFDDDIILENGRSRDVRVLKGGNFSGIQYLIITVDIPNLITAQWKSN